MPYSGHWCIAPNCKSGYGSKKNRENAEKVHMFSVPSAKEVVEKWQQAIPRKDFIVKSGQVVCQKHFNPEDIIWKREVKDPQGNVMASEMYKIPRLRKGALPSIFPICPKYLTKTRVNERAPRPKRETSSDPKKKTKRALSTSTTKNSVAKENPVRSNSKKLEEALQSEFENLEVVRSGFENFEPVQSRFDNFESDQSRLENFEPDQSRLENFEPVEKKRLKSSLPEATEESRLALFDFLFQSKESFKINSAWSRCDIEENELRAIQFMYCTGRLDDGIIKTVVQKKIILCKDMSVQASVMDMLIENQKIGLTLDFISSPEEVEKMIAVFHEARICQGCAPPDSTNYFETFVYQDFFGTLRHNDCSLILDENTPSNKKSCQKCRISKIALANNAVFL